MASAASGITTGGGCGGTHERLTGCSLVCAPKCPVFISSPFSISVVLAFFCCHQGSAPAFISPASSISVILAFFCCHQGSVLLPSN
ncbi:hypothetical protein OIU77_007699 [Salix suchowensis]|uniref:Uncharacterized protein n=1 Tax=Salix suchowensis TaxID=1278906 RepID=A0ABQ9AH81_9ROSI|nr:hypothetical protein OIU77_007699 [Salix suchowensis]